MPVQPQKKSIIGLTISMIFLRALVYLLKLTSVIRYCLRCILSPKLVLMFKLLLTCIAYCLISLNLSAHETDGHEKRAALRKNTKILAGKNKMLTGKNTKGKKNKAKKSRRKAGIKVRSSNKGRKNAMSPKRISKIGGKKIDLDDFSRNKGKFNWPLEEGIIKTGFGPYKVGYGTIIGNNPGLTLEAEQGSCVQSVFEGVVTDLFEMEGKWGVTIQHGNYFTVYSNLATVNVSEDDKIVSGAAIGKAACNEEGNAELEFLILKKNKNIDPQPWIRKN